MKSQPQTSKSQSDIGLDLAIQMMGGVQPIKKFPLQQEIQNFVEPLAPKLENISSYSLKRSGINSVWHETNLNNAHDLVFSHGDFKKGLNVATSPEFALGQKGKGVIIEMDTSQLSGNKINKPMSNFITEATGIHPEYALTDAPMLLEPHVKSIIFNKPITLQEERRFFGLRDNWKITKEILPDGRIKYTNPIKNTLFP